MQVWVRVFVLVWMQVISGLLKYWPYGSSTKQIMFLHQLEDLFEYVQVLTVCFPTVLLSYCPLVSLPLILRPFRAVV